MLITIPLGISLVLVLETMARGTAVLAFENSRIGNGDGDGDDLTYLIQKDISSTITPDCHTTTNHTVGMDGTRITYVFNNNNYNNSNKVREEDHSELLLVGEKKIELADLAEMFLGPKGKYCFILFVR